MHGFYTDPESEPMLAEELSRAGIKSAVAGSQWVMAEADLAVPWVFARQTLPNVQTVEAASINAWADVVINAIIGTLPEESAPWRLHVVALYGEVNAAGRNRCDLIQKAVRERLQKRRRSLLRLLDSSATVLTPQTSVVQVMLTDPGRGYLSVAATPLAHEARRNVWPFPCGDVPWVVDKTAPSRAFSKLMESEHRLGRYIKAGETCVDLGACPGSWSYVALSRGARVTAVDRTELREDLMRDRKLTFVRGDAFKFEPTTRVDWLVCDVIAAPQRNMELLLHWLRAGLTRQFIVSLKFKGEAEYAVLEQLKAELPALCNEWYLTRLCANRNEACAFGVAK